MRSEVTFVPATQELAERYYTGRRPPIGFRGYVALLGGEPVGVGGVHRMGGGFVAFSEMKDSMRQDRRACARATRLLIDFVDNLGCAVYAVADSGEPTSERLLARLGFTGTGVQTAEGELLVRPGYAEQTTQA
jgi:RimJ/RimL family protein N-acetyltransferase